MATFYDNLRGAADQSRLGNKTCRLERFGIK